MIKSDLNKELAFKINKYVRVLLVIVFSVFVFLLPKNYANAYETPQIRVLQNDFANKVFDKSLNNGQGIFYSEQDIKDQNNLNKQIWLDNGGAKVSLYDRFGPNVQFIPYYGETKIYSTLIDNFYTVIKNNKFPDNVGAFINLFFAPKYESNNSIYPNRPDIGNGNKDPRRAIYTGMSITGGFAQFGNIFLMISNVFSQITGFIVSPGIVDAINGIWTGAISNPTLMDVLKIITGMFVTLAAVSFMYRLVTLGIKFANGRTTFKHLASVCFNIFGSAAIIYATLAAPTAVSDLFVKVVKIPNDVFSYAMTAAPGSDETNSSSNLKNVIPATIWKTAILQPYCHGMFQDDYKNLYTSYGNGGKMPQAPESAKVTGQVEIRLGGGSTTSNWCALTYSTQSRYHVNAVKDDPKPDVQPKNDDIWPKATLTPENNQVYLDDFRWIDAKLNVGSSSFTSYKETFISDGIMSVFIALLMIPILINGFKMFYYLLTFIISALKLIYYSLFAIVIPDKYSIVTNVKRLINPVKMYIYFSFISFILITLYQMLVGYDMFKNILFALVAFVILTKSPAEMAKFVTDSINKAKAYGKEKTNEAKNIINNARDNRLKPKTASATVNNIVSTANK